MADKDPYLAESEAAQKILEYEDKIERLQELVFQPGFLDLVASFERRHEMLALEFVAKVRRGEIVTDDEQRELNHWAKGGQFVLDTLERTQLNLKKAQRDFDKKYGTN